MFLVNKETRKNGGITLVALVITIVILIILAVVAVNAVFGDSGLLKYAQDAEQYQSNADTADAEVLNEATSYIDGIITGKGGSSGGDDTKVPTTVEEAKNAGGSNVYFFDNTAALKDGQNNTVKVPGGFGVSKDSGINVEDGVVIEDRNGNQFVWIPVGTYNTTDTEEATKTNVLSRRSWGTEQNVVQEPEVVEDSAAIEECYGENSDNFKTSAVENSGFYVGRYEQGEGNVSKAGLQPVQINKQSNAKADSEAMYANNEFVTSELISSYAWDTVLNFICQNSEYGYVLATTTSSEYGNLGEDTSVQLTGSYEQDNYSNIHDFIGNVREWTTETSSASHCGVATPYVHRSSKASGGWTTFAADRSSAAGDLSGYRVQLYIEK